MLDISQIGLHQLLREKKSFVLYRQPKTQNSQFILGQETYLLHKLSELSQFAEEEAYIFAPFEAKENAPIILIKGSKQSIQLTQVSETTIAQLQHSDIEPNCDEAYHKAFECFSEKLQCRAFSKLVLARKKSLQIEQEINLEELFVRATKCYPSAYIYLFFSPLSGLWFGASPELLLEQNHLDCRTISLAGTQKKVANQLNYIWSEKLLQEQDYVTSYIREQILHITDQLDEAQRTTSEAGELVHLKTELNFRLHSPQAQINLLDHLHPTPAVCGLPKQEAKAFILANEGFDRTYYTGFLGEITPHQSSKLYVNIRSMQIEDKSLTLYAGGGLLAQSKKDEEWLETEIKMKTMQKLISTSLSDK